MVSAGGAATYPTVTLHGPSCISPATQRSAVADQPTYTFKSRWKRSDKSGKAGAKDLTDPQVQASMKDDQMFKSIKEGMTKDGKTLMKPAKDLTHSDHR